MSEETTVHPAAAETTTEVGPSRATVVTPRRRQPKQDVTLAQAVEIARQAVEDSAGAQNVGEHLGIEVHEDRLLTHLFDCSMAGYPGWTWFATVTRAPRVKLVTVCEVGLLAGEKSLLAPAWVPWEERMQAVNEQNEDRDGQDEESTAEEMDDAPEAGAGAEQFGAAEQSESAGTAESVRSTENETSS